MIGRIGVDSNIPSLLMLLEAATGRRRVIVRGYPLVKDFASGHNVFLSSLYKQKPTLCCYEIIGVDPWLLHTFLVILAA
jgi:hypothetical protein